VKLRIAGGARHTRSFMHEGTLFLSEWCGPPEETVRFRPIPRLRTDTAFTAVASVAPDRIATCYIDVGVSRCDRQSRRIRRNAFSMKIAAFIDEFGGSHISRDGASFAQRPGVAMIAAAATAIDPNQERTGDEETREPSL
jgi:hypothetical protein